MNSQTPRSTQEAREGPSGRIPAREECIGESPTLISRLEEMQRLAAVRDETMRTLLAAEDAEDTRVSRMLHDNVGQYVAALQLTLRGLEKELESGGNVQLTLQSLQAITQSVGQELHKVALELRPTSLDDHGLVRSLTTFLDEWSLQTKIAVDFDYLAFGEERLPLYFETTFFRVIREALHQLAEQARASRVSVIFQRHHDCVIAVIEDNDTHFDCESAEGIRHDPLAHIKGRVSLLGGEVSVEAAADGGKTIFVRLPLSRKP